MKNGMLHLVFEARLRANHGWKRERERERLWGMFYCDPMVGTKCTYQNLKRVHVRANMECWWLIYQVRWLQPLCRLKMTSNRLWREDSGHWRGFWAGTKGLILPVLLLLQMYNNQDQGAELGIISQSYSLFFLFFFSFMCTYCAFRWLKIVSNVCKYTMRVFVVVGVFFKLCRKKGHVAWLFYVIVLFYVIGLSIRMTYTNY